MKNIEKEKLYLIIIIIFLIIFSAGLVLYSHTNNPSLTKNALSRVASFGPLWIFDKNESSDLITFNGDLKVGKSILNETFSSHVSFHKETDKIIVTNLDGPLKHLKNEWHFKEINNNTQLEFFIDFELKNPILNGIMKKSFELGLNKIAKAFEERAIKIFK